MFPIKSILLSVYALALLVYPASSQIKQWAETGLGICTANGWQRNPKITMDAADGLIVAWEDIRVGTNPAIYAARLTVEGQLPWQANGVLISSASSGQTIGGIASDGNGGAYIVYWNRKGGSYDIYVQRVDGTGNLLGPASGYVICGASGDQQFAGIISDGSGGAIVAWQDLRSSNNDIYAQRITSDGTTLWGDNGILVTGATGDQLYPELAGDKLGGAYIIWMDRRTEDDIYMQYIEADGKRAWADDLPVAVFPNRQIAPKIVSMADNRCAVIWQDSRYGATVPAVFIQIVDRAGQQLYLDGYRLAESQGSTKPQSGIYLTEDGEGGAMASWTDFRNGQNDGDVYMGRVLADGSIPPLGSVFGEPIAAIPGSMQEIAPLLPDSAGGAFVVWQDWRNGLNYDLFMNRVSGTMKVNYPEWNPTGLQLVQHDNNQISPQVISSGRGAVIVVWTDGRVFDGQADLYAQRVLFSPWVIASKNEMSFGVHRILTTVVDTLTFTNTGVVPLAISDIRRPPTGVGFADFRILNTFQFPLSLPPDSSLTIAISFTPREVGNRHTEIRLNSNFAKDPFIVTARGVGTDPKILTPVNFIVGPGKIGSYKDTVIERCIQNIGTGTLLVNHMDFTGDNPDDFELVDDPPKPIPIPEGESYDVKIRFKPVAEGSRTAQLRIFNNTTDSVKLITIRGAGGYPIFNNNPLVLRFDYIELTKTQTKQIQIINTGGVPLVVVAIGVQGSHATSFEALPGMLPFTVGAGSTHMLDVLFKPQELGLLKATLVCISDDPRSPHQIEMEGNSVPLDVQELPPVELPIKLGQNFPNPASTTKGSIVPVTVTGNRPVIISVEIQDVLGRKVGVLFHGLMEPGYHELASDPFPLKPGVYHIRLHTTFGSTSRVMIVE